MQGRTDPQQERRRTLDDFELTSVVSHLLRRAHFRAEALFETEIGQAFGITPRQKALLISAYQHPGATVNELAERIALDRVSAAEMLSRLVQRGLLRRDRSTRDGRAWAVSITDEGIALLEEVMPHDAEVEKAVLAPLPPEYRPLFVKCLRLMTSVEKEDT